MAQIDKFIDELHRLSADHLEVAAGAKLALGLNGTRHDLSARPLTPAQVDRLLGEIKPGRFETGPNGTHFTYKSPSGAVRVLVTSAEGAPRFVVSPVDGNSDPAASGDNDPRGTSQPGNEAAGRAEVRAGSGSPKTTGPGRSRIEELFRTMVKEGCSDLHISTGVRPLFRKDGGIVSLGDESPLTADEAREMLLSIAPTHKREEFERLHDTDFAYEIPDVARFRCNLFADRRGIGGVFRVIPSKVKSVEDLGLPPEIVELCRLPRGLVLVTGPTGSGKSTTLAAMIDYINRTRADHIVTIEDPIEFVHPNQKCLINQREIGTHTEGFKVALRAALREDPDVVLVGEMRDLETVAIAIETAETGHLVFGTVHTRTAASTVDRLIDQFPADQQSQIRIMLAESLKGVISQTLVKGKSGGRVAAMEFLLVNTAVANLIREGKAYQIPSVMQTSKGKGMQTLSDALFELVKNDQVEPHTAYRAAADKSTLKHLFERAGISLG